MPENKTEGSEPEVTADHFEVVTAAMAAKKAANEANSEAFKAATEKLDELQDALGEESKAIQERNEALYVTRETVRASYNATAKRIERDYRVAIYGEAHVAREEAATSRRRAEY